MLKSGVNKTNCWRNQVSKAVSVEGKECLMFQVRTCIKDPLESAKGAEPV